MFNNDNIKEIDIIEFGEFILSIIHEYVQNNIKLMSNQKYISIIRETVLEIINGCYGNILPYNELFEIIDNMHSNCLVRHFLLAEAPATGPVIQAWNHSFP